MATQIVYSKEFLKHDATGHPENAERLQVMLEELKKSSFYSKLEVVTPNILPEDPLYDIHSDFMINEIKELSKQELTWIDLDTYVCKNDYKIARLAAGSLLQLCKNVVNGKTDNAFALIRPPGHHATKNRSMGFCLFNNAAIAANEIAKTGKKILIFDFDIHHGNGTQDIFYDRADVMYQSFHLFPYYPGTGAVSEIGIGEGEGYTINAPLSYGCGNIAVSKILDKIFLPIAKEFQPDLIIISAGYDSHFMDPLGGLKLTTKFYGDITRKFMDIQPNLVVTLEGGYNLSWIGKCLVSQLATMSDSKINFNDKTEETENIGGLIKEIKNELKSYWAL